MSNVDKMVRIQLMVDLVQVSGLVKYCNENKILIEHTTFVESKRRVQLPDDQKLEIIAKYEAGVYQSVLAKEYGVSQATISRIVG